ncbi:MAG TPA: MFS transporter, partial [Longimicrobiales bacterium]|nr:MFS transporter [Longimicrobiales bacterium]
MEVSQEAQLACPHVAELRPVEPTSEGCEECLAMGAEWVHLRVCLSCGHVGCCDASEHRHARRHFEHTGHPVMTPRSDDEPWAWCFVDDVAITGDWSSLWHPKPDGMAAHAVPLLPILLVNFIGTLGFGLVLPFLVFLVTDWGGNAFVYGLVGATYSAFQLVGAPILGRWSDRYGRRKVLLLSQAGTLVSWLIFLVAFALPVREVLTFESAATGPVVLTVPLLVVFVARALDGITGGNVSVANA